MEFDAFMRASESHDEAFFELANAPVVRYEVAGKKLDISQDVSLHDSCGGIIWETSFALSQYLQRNLQQRAQGRTLSELKVVELGAGPAEHASHLVQPCSVPPHALNLCMHLHHTGCGLLGLSLAAAFGCSAVITDTQQVLSLVRDNIQRNAAHLEPHPPLAMPLDWESASDLRAVSAKGTFDLLVATDVVRPRRPLRPAHVLRRHATYIVWAEEMLLCWVRYAGVRRAASGAPARLRAYALQSALVCAAAHAGVPVPAGALAGGIQDVHDDGS